MRRTKTGLGGSHKEKEPNEIGMRTLQDNEIESTSIDEMLKFPDKVGW